MSDSTWLLIDGSAVAYRAFYAIAELSTRDGRPTNALFGFIRMLQQLEQVWKPSHWAVVFDGGLPEARMTLLPEYKAQRKPMPDALRAQFAFMEEYLVSRQLPSIRLPGEEADDVLASMTHQVLQQSGQVLMATSDKDMFQLVSDRVGIVAPSKTGERMGPAEVFAKTGVYPASVVEWQALIGDTVDNIPGVPGIGPKTAAKLLQESGSLADMLAHPERINPGRIRDLVTGHADTIRRNLKLMRLRTDLEGFPESSALQWVPSRADRLNPFFEKMDLHSFLLKPGAAAPVVRRESPVEQQGLFSFGVSESRRE